jgi:hypothetical protein
MELRYRLTDDERVYLRSMVELTAEMSRWRSRPILITLLVSLLGLAACTFYVAMSKGRGIHTVVTWSQEVSEFLTMVAAWLCIAAVMFVVLKYGVYRPRLLRAKRDLDMLAATKIGNSALAVVERYLTLQDHFREFLMFTGEYKPPTWMLSTLAKQYAARIQIS